MAKVSEEVLAKAKMLQDALTEHLNAVSIHTAEAKVADGQLALLASKAMQEAGLIASNHQFCGKCGTIRPINQENCAECSQKKG